MSTDCLGGIMGLVVADALGVPVEFMSREKLLKNPVTDMREYGTYNQPKGTWSDDSTMTLCLLESLTKWCALCAKSKREHPCTSWLNYNDIFSKFHDWLKNGYMTPHGECFDIGGATYKAITRYERGINPLECGGKSEQDNGNGSLMRILPMAFYTKTLEQNERFDLVHNISRLTHAHNRSLIACGIYIQYAVLLLNDYNKSEAIDKTIEICKEYYNNDNELKHYERILNGKITVLDISDIRSSGYVVDSLEAAIWSFLTTSNYAECVLKAVNLGGDTDTIGAIAGGLAGIYYGYEAIPEEWKSVIVKRQEIETICKNFSEHASECLSVH